MWTIGHIHITKCCRMFFSFNVFPSFLFFNSDFITFPLWSVSYVRLHELEVQVTEA